MFPALQLAIQHMYLLTDVIRSKWPCIERIAQAGREKASVERFIMTSALNATLYWAPAVLAAAL